MLSVHVAACRRGFTLVEMMVTVVIVGILASASVPMYTGQTKRAKMTEAMAGLGAIRTEQRVFFSEHGTYMPVVSPNIANEPTAANPGLGLDFRNNAYFGNACFSVDSDAMYGFVAHCDGSATSTQPRASEVSALKMEMRGNGQGRYSFDGGATWTSWQ
jgi:prepilin-type N-terminal cleavage/methylation domain-containing protein